MRSRRSSRLWALLLLALAALVVAPVGALAHTPAHVAVAKLSARVAKSKTFRLSRAATHVAVHWQGNPGARVLIAFSRDSRHFGAAHLVTLDEVGMARHNGETYGTLEVARGVKAVRVFTDRPLRRLSLLVVTDHGGAMHELTRLRAAAAAPYPQPTVISRAGWGADESLRFDTSGKEIWPPAFYPVQKLILHHTATQNNDPDPAATMRSIYYYHAVTQGWGDIGYNFVIDEAGNIYEGRHSRDYSGVSPTGADANGNGVTAAHAYGYNTGTDGIALLGTLSNQDATPAARNALERLLAWEASTHGIDPQGSALYTNPVNGTQKTFSNISGHRDVAATECPGATFYATLPIIRSDVAALLGGTPAPPPPAAVTLSSLSLSPSSVTAGSASTGTVTLTAAAPAGGATVGLSSTSPAATTPASIVVPAGAKSASFTVSTHSVSTSTTASIYASYGGIAKTATITVKRRRGV